MFKAQLALRDHKDRRVLKALKDSSVHKERLVLDSLAHKGNRELKVYKARPAQALLAHKGYKVAKASRVSKDLLVRKVHKGLKDLKDLRDVRVFKAR